MTTVNYRKEIQATVQEWLADATAQDLVKHSVVAQAVVDNFPPPEGARPYAFYHAGGYVQQMPALVLLQAVCFACPISYAMFPKRALAWCMKHAAGIDPAKVAAAIQVVQNTHPKTAVETPDEKLAKAMTEANQQARKGAPPEMFVYQGVMFKLGADGQYHEAPDATP